MTPDTAWYKALPWRIIGEGTSPMQAPSQGVWKPWTRSDTIASQESRDHAPQGVIYARLFLDAPGHVNSLVSTGDRSPQGLFLSACSRGRLSPGLRLPPGTP